MGTFSRPSQARFIYVSTCGCHQKWLESRILDERAHGGGCRGGDERRFTARRRSTPGRMRSSSNYDEDSAGWRPPCLSEPPGPQERVEQHIVKPRLSYPCAAVGEPAGGDREVHRHLVSCREGCRCARDPGGHPTACRGLCTAVCGTVGGRATSPLIAAGDDDTGTAQRRWQPYVVAGLTGSTGGMLTHFNPLDLTRGTRFEVDHDGLIVRIFFGFQF